MEKMRNIFFIICLFFSSSVFCQKDLVVKADDDNRSLIVLTDNQVDIDTIKIFMMGVSLRTHHIENNRISFVIETYDGAITYDIMELKNKIWINESFYYLDTNTYKRGSSIEPVNPTYEISPEGKLYHLNSNKKEKQLVDLDQIRKMGFSTHTTLDKH